MITILVCSTMLTHDACTENTAFSLSQAAIVSGMMCEFAAQQYVAASGLLDMDGDGIADPDIYAKILCPRNR
jgi:hypothetical protein